MNRKITINFQKSRHYEIFPGFDFKKPFLILRVIIPIIFERSTQ